MWSVAGRNKPCDESCTDDRQDSAQRHWKPRAFQADPPADSDRADDPTKVIQRESLTGLFDREMACEQDARQPIERKIHSKQAEEKRAPERQRISALSSRKEGS